MILLAVCAGCTLSHLTDPTNVALEEEIFLLEVCLQYIGTHLMVQLTGIITHAALLGHPKGEKEDTLTLTSPSWVHQARGPYLAFVLWALSADLEYGIPCSPT